MTTEPQMQAVTVCDELAGVLQKAGIVLPSLGIDPVSYSSERPGILVELGRCNLDTARRLIAVLNRAADR